MKKLLVLFFVSLILMNCQAQDLPKLTNQDRQSAVDSFAVLLEKYYVFPDKGLEMAKLIRQNLKKGNYNKITDPIKFSDQITADLQSLSKDKHLRARYAPERVKEMRAANNQDDAPNDRIIAEMKQGNYAFKEVKILEGNVGYLRLDGFVDAAFGSETAIAAMNFLANTNAIIIDLRYNGGGSPSMIQLITSYLYTSEPVHLNNFYFRPDNVTTQTWTLPYVPGQRMPNTPVYVLTSQRTFSAAEEFTYNLKNLKRATIVGETTGGGAHPGGSRVANDMFLLWVPVGRAINPVTQTNWEGTGVEPDVKTEKEKALDHAYMLALENISKTAAEDYLKNVAQWQIVRLKAQMNPVNISAEKLKSYAGDYDVRNVSFENGNLYYQRSGSSKYKLYPITEDTFGLEGLEYFRIHFITENNQVKAIEGLYDNGRKDMSPKNTK